MLNTMLNTDVIALSVYVDYDALTDNIKRDFAGEFIREISSENTICKITKERNAYGGETVYSVEITCFYVGEEFPDTVSKFVDLNCDEKAAFDELISHGVQYALEHINDSFED